MAMDPATAKVVVGLALRLRGLLRYLLYALAGIVLLAVLLIGLPLVVIVSGSTGAFASEGGPPSGPDGEMIRRYETIYKVAADHYQVNWYLLASIHRQESNFSRLRGNSFVGDAVSGGWNRCGAAGPMQMGIVGVSPYHGTTDGSCSAGGTWTGHRAAFAPIATERPDDYPQQRTELAACRDVPPQEGCVYDDFDAIAGAAHKLRMDGATTDLYSEGTFQAVCRYIGSCSNVENCGGPNDYCQVLPRARQWEAEGAGNVGPVPPPQQIGDAVFPVSPPGRISTRFAAVDALHARPHTGIDIAHPTAGIFAFHAGRVSLVQKPGNVTSGYGNFVCIDHPALRVQSCYAHLLTGSVRVQSGQPVHAGDRIATIGSTGRSTGPHLHFEIRSLGQGARTRWLCPAPYIGLSYTDACARPSL